MNDRELLDLAARGAGIDVTFRGDEPYGRWKRTRGSGVMYWDPLGNDGDALRLAILLNMELRATDDRCTCKVPNVTPLQDVFVSGNPTLAVRRAIVMTAAAIGKEME